MPRIRSWTLARQSIASPRPARTVKTGSGIRQVLATHRKWTPVAHRVGSTGHAPNHVKRPPRPANFEYPVDRERLFAYEELSDNQHREEWLSVDDIRLKRQWLEENSGEEWPGEELWKKQMRLIRAPYGVTWRIKRRKVNIAMIPCVQAMPRHIAVRPRLKCRLIRKAWKTLDHGEKDEQAQAYLLQALNDSPALAFQILKDCLDVEGIALPSGVIRHTVNHVILATLSATDRHYHGHRQDHALVYRARRITQESVYSWAARVPNLLSHRTVDRLVKRLARNDLTRFVRFIRSRISTTLNLHVATLCKIIRQCTQTSSHRAALSLLRAMTRTQLESEIVQAEWVMYLRHHFHVNHALHLQTRTELVAELLEQGIAPREHLRNSMVAAAMEAGDEELGWKIFETTTKHGLKATEQTYRALLSHPSSTVEQIRKIVDAAARDRVLDLSVSTQAMAAVVNSINISEGRMLQPFDSALQIYSRLFDMRPLEELGLVSARKTWPSTSPKFPPRPHLLEFVIQTFCQQNAGSWRLWQTYRRYMELGFSGHRSFATCMSRPYAAEAFMMGMKQTPELLRACTEILQDMLDTPREDKYAPPQGIHLAFEPQDCDEPGTIPLAAARDYLGGTINQGNQGIQVLDGHHETYESSDKGRKTVVAKPRRETWNILLHGLVEARDMEAAGKVLALMQERRYKPTTATWNILLLDPARDQDVTEVVATVEAMERAGVKATAYTKTTIGKIVNRGALIDALDEAMRRRNSAGAEQEDVHELQSLKWDF